MLVPLVQEAVRVVQEIGKARQLDCDPVRLPAQAIRQVAQADREGAQADQ